MSKQPTIEDVYDMLKLVLKRQVSLEKKLTAKEKVPYVMSEEEKTRLRFKVNSKAS